MLTVLTGFASDHNDQGDLLFKTSASVRHGQATGWLGVPVAGAWNGGVALVTNRRLAGRRVEKNFGVVE